MGFRVELARTILNFSAFIQTLPLVIMRPDDLINFSHKSYAKPQMVESWADQDLIDSGLTVDEITLLNDLPKTGRLLLLGVGGGREAIHFARMGYSVTGVDYVTAMIDRALENAARRGVQLEGIVQEISRIEIADNTFDIIWMSRSMYSCIPTRARRVEMVKRIAKGLKPGGYFVCQYHGQEYPVHSRKYKFLRKTIALLTCGNSDFQEGDMLWLNVEFAHSFSTEFEIRSELENGGLTVISIRHQQSQPRCGAICRK